MTFLVSEENQPIDIVETHSIFHIILDPERVSKVLQERFGLTEPACRVALQHFQQWYHERDWKRSVGLWELMEFL
jgi:hypothetical protein